MSVVQPFLRALRKYAGAEVPIDYAQVITKKVAGRVVEFSSRSQVI